MGRDEGEVSFEKAKQGLTWRASSVGSEDRDGLVSLHLLDLEDADAFQDLGPKTETIVDPFAVNWPGKSTVPVTVL